ncbi:hypothetical protein [Streptomyces incanus]|uniref:Uncharacterized protein n=1 Tax=Streptomyces incanus TaxID=887453 RepID=A0ABW0XNR8_9ACTN
MTDLVEQWTEVHGADRTADVSDTVAGYPHQVFRGAGWESGGRDLRRHRHGARPARRPGGAGGQCGTAGAYFPDVNLCAAHRLGSARGLG